MIEDKEQLAYHLKKKLAIFSSQYSRVPDKADILEWIIEFENNSPREYWKCDTCGKKFITVGDAIMCCSDKRGEKR